MIDALLEANLMHALPPTKTLMSSLEYRARGALTMMEIVVPPSTLPLVGLTLTMSRNTQ